jgi:uncharacterized protein YcbK (DUF882 family)|tara:strand:+ start:308 stop:694 length:387 start_codon:yes stop_codon:yes gene_type:complete
MKLTKNFNKSEFESKDGSEMPNEVFYNIQKVANQLQILRNYLGRSIRVNSAYRSPKHNASIGGVKNSQHVLGKASDIVVAGLTTTEVYKVIEELIDKGDMLQGGLGLYNSFVHYDIRGSRARWNNTTK